MENITEEDCGYVPKEYQNINGLVGVLVANRIATLHELQTVYSLQDAMDMYEAYIVPKYNEYKNAQAMRRKAKRQ